MDEIRHLIYLSVILFFTFFSKTQVALAKSNISTQANTPTPVVALVIAWVICRSRENKPIGGWLLFYYIQLFSGAFFLISTIFILGGVLLENLNLANWGGHTGQYLLYIISVIPYYIVLIVEVVIGSMLLIKKFRNKKTYNLLRVIIAAHLVLGLITLLIDYNYWPEAIVSDILPIVLSTFWLLYFSLSERVHLVFIENKWEKDDKKEGAIKKMKNTFVRYLTKFLS